MGTRSLRRRLSLAALVALLVPVGLARMAENTVDPSYAGTVEMSVKLGVDTSLALDDAKVNVAQGSYRFQNMKATLTQTSDGAPVEGATIVFKVASVAVCTDTTNQKGQVNCQANTRFDPSTFPATTDPTTLPYTAEFAGGSGYLPAAATAGLTKVG